MPGFLKSASLALILMLAATVNAYAGFKDFSAVMVTDSDGEKMKSKVNMSDKKQRMEPLDVDSDSRSATIIRQDKKVVWVLMPSEKMYMEMPMSNRYSSPLTSEDRVVVKDLGPEKVDGRPTKKQLVKTTDEDGETTEMYVWTDNELSVPIKAESVDGDFSYWYEDIKVGKQDPDLFEVPRRYEKMSMGDRYGRPSPPRPHAPRPEPPDYPDPRPDVPSLPGIPTPW